MVMTMASNQSEVIPNVLATLAQVMDKLGKPNPSEITLKGMSAELRNLADYLLEELPCTADRIDNIETTSRMSRFGRNSM